MDSMVEEPPPPQPPPPLPDLIFSLEQATFMAKQLTSTADPTHLLQIQTSLHRAHYHLSTFLSIHQFLPPPLLPLLPQAENSFSSANGATPDDNEPMQVGDENEGVEAEETSKCTIDKVEEKLRDCFIKNKRQKRPLSPSTAAVGEERRLSDDGFVGGVRDYDPHATRLRALELVYQFHG